MALEYSTVTGLYRTMVADTPDDDNDLPNLEPLVGTIEFIPQVDYVIQDNGDFLYPAPSMAVLNDEGRVSYNGSEGIALLSPKSAGINPSNWSYIVRMRLTTKAGIPVRINDFRFSPAPGSVPLNQNTPIPSAGVTAITRGLSAYELAVTDGFVGTLTEWLDSLKAPGAGGASRLQVIPLSAPWPTEAPAGTLVVRVQEGA